MVRWAGGPGISASSCFAQRPAGSSYERIGRPQNVAILFPVSNPSVKRYPHCVLAERFRAVRPLSWVFAWPWLPAVCHVSRSERVVVSWPAYDAVEAEYDV